MATHKTVGRSNTNSKLTSIGLKKTTKARLNTGRAPGQCYDGFLCQLMDLWEEIQVTRKPYTLSPAGRNQGVGVSNPLP